MRFLQSIQALVISAVMLVNPLLLPPDLRPTNQTAEGTSIKIVPCEVPNLCGGGTETLKEWECKAAVCCQTNGKWYFYHDGRSCETPKPAPAAKPTVQPTQKQQAPTSNQIDCTGPDGKHLFVTQKECDDFNAAWGKKNGNTQSQPSTNNGGQKNEPEVTCVLSWATVHTTQANCTTMKNADAPKDYSQRNANYDSCLKKMFDKQNACTTECSSTRDHASDVCFAAYAGAYPLIKNDAGLLNDCLAEVDKNNESCWAVCSEPVQKSACIY